MQAALSGGGAPCRRVILVTAGDERATYIALAIMRWRLSTARAAKRGPLNIGKNSKMRFAFALILGLVTIGAAQAQTVAGQQPSTTYLDTSTPSFSRSHAQQYNTANGQ